MLFAPEFAVPFRAGDLESSPDKICTVGKDTPEWPHTRALYDMLTHTTTTKANT